MTEKAYAKINLWLDVVGKRADGYHNIESVMTSVSLHDTLDIEIADTISMSVEGSELSCGDDNLCIKAAKAFFGAAQIDGGCHITLTKRIPMQAGLGGGSSDAAAVLRGLNSLYAEPLNTNDLLGLSAKIGADVPFCLAGGCKKAEGIGEILSDFVPLPKCHAVICQGSGKMSTPEAYKMIDALPPHEKPSFEDFESAMKEGDLSKIGDLMYNEFELIVPQCKALADMLRTHGAKAAMMSGSGTAVFGLFDSKEKAETAVSALNKQNILAHYCEVGERR